MNNYIFKYDKYCICEMIIFVLNCQYLLGRSVQSVKANLKLWFYNFRIPLLMVLSFLIAINFGDDMPRNYQNFFYTFSLSIQSLIVFILPFIIFSFLFSCIGNLSSGALRFVLLLLPMICISNYIAVIAAYFSSYAVIEQLHFISVLKVYKRSGLIVSPILGFTITSFICK